MASNSSNRKKEKTLPMSTTNPIRLTQFRKIEERRGGLGAGEFIDGREGGSGEIRMRNDKRPKKSQPENSKHQHSTAREASNSKSQAPLFRQPLNLKVGIGSFSEGVEC